MTGSGIRTNGNQIADWFAEGKPIRDQIIILSRLASLSARKLSHSRNLTEERAVDTYIDEDDSICGLYERLAAALENQNLERLGRRLRVTAESFSGKSGSYVEWAPDIGGGYFRHPDRILRTVKFTTFRKDGIVYRKLALLIISKWDIKVPSIPRGIDVNVKRTVKGFNEAATYLNWAASVIDDSDSSGSQA